MADETKTKTTVIVQSNEELGCGFMLLGLAALIMALHYVGCM